MKLTLSFLPRFSHEQWDTVPAAIITYSRGIDPWRKKSRAPKHRPAGKQHLRNNAAKCGGSRIPLDITEGDNPKRPRRLAPGFLSPHMANLFSWHSAWSRRPVGALGFHWKKGSSSLLCRNLARFNEAVLTRRAAREFRGQFFSLQGARTWGRGAVCCPGSWIPSASSVRAQRLPLCPGVSNYKDCIEN